MDPSRLDGRHPALRRSTRDVAPADQVRAHSALCVCTRELIGVAVYGLPAAAAAAAAAAPPYTPAKAVFRAGGPNTPQPRYVSGSRTPSPPREVSHPLLVLGFLLPFSDEWPLVERIRSHRARPARLGGPDGDIITINPINPISRIRINIVSRSRSPVTTTQSSPLGLGMTAHARKMMTTMTTMTRARAASRCSPHRLRPRMPAHTRSGGTRTGEAHNVLHSMSIADDGRRSRTLDPYRPTGMTPNPSQVYIITSRKPVMYSRLQLGSEHVLFSRSDAPSHAPPVPPLPHHGPRRRATSLLKCLTRGGLALFDINPRWAKRRPLL
jgi:hypothetical protein